MCICMWVCVYVVYVWLVGKMGVNYGLGLCKNGGVWKVLVD